VRVGESGWEERILEVKGGDGKDRVAYSQDSQTFPARKTLTEEREG